MAPDDLHTWAARYPEAAAALAALYPDMRGANDGPEELEAAAMARIQLQASKQGIWLLRNNSGVLPNPSGRPVRFGLGNISKQINDIVKSSDFIGAESKIVTPEMVGSRVAILWAVEAKPDGWTYTGTKREMGQRAFGIKVTSLGGKFCFSTGRGPL